MKTRLTVLALLLALTAGCGGQTTGFGKPVDSMIHGMPVPAEAESILEIAPDDVGRWYLGKTLSPADLQKWYDDQLGESHTWDPAWERSYAEFKGSGRDQVFYAQWKNAARNCQIYLNASWSDLSKDFKEERAGFVMWIEVRPLPEQCQ